MSNFLKSFLGFQEGPTTFTYLGVSIFRGIPMKQHLQVIADRVRGNLESWMGKLLSMAGRVQLVQFVIQAMLIHSFMIYQWPCSLLKQMSGWIRNFIWTGSCDTRKMIFIS